MLKANSRNFFRACVLIASVALIPLAFADLIEPVPLVPPANGVYALPDTCVSVVCLENIALSNFDVTRMEIVGGNELTVSNVSLTANAFQNVSGMPGTFISPLVLNGQVDITYFDKSTVNELGTFNTQVTSLDLTGVLNGHTLNAILNPADTSTGQTTVTAITSQPPTIKVSSFFDVFAELSIDGGTFVPGPERVADLTTTPEPAYYGTIGILLAAIVTLRVVKSTKPTGA